VLRELPNQTVVDGEILALDPEGKPSFNLLQNYGSSPSFPVFFYVFDRYLPGLDGSLADLTRAVREQGLEGLVAKRRDSVYEPGAPVHGAKCASIRARNW
jgi:ATP-dependent DNA ligase